MRLGVLFSGGKDSTYALMKAMRKEDVSCLISIFSENKESYMFHTPNIEVTNLQAQSIGLPQVKKATAGEKEGELADLKGAITEAVEDYGIEGVVSGAIESVYQAKRLQVICDELGLWCFNPLWKKDQPELLNEILGLNFKVIISGVSAYPFDETWLGREIDENMVRELITLRDKHGISPSGEGGEIETCVLDAPIFKKRVEVVEYEKYFSGNSGIFAIKKARLAGK